LQGSLTQQAPKHQRVQLSKKQLAALVYVGVALSAIGVATFETNHNIQWFSAVDSLDVKSSPTYHFENQSLGYPFVKVTATLTNPTQFKGIFVTFVVYNVFVDSISRNESFKVKGSSQIGSLGFAVDQAVLPMKSLNITGNVPLLSDVVDPLKSFIQTYNQTGMVTYVQTSVYMTSVYGAFVNDFCIEYPASTSTACPGIRPTPNFKSPGG